MKAYVVKVDRCAYDTGRYTKTDTIAYYLDEEKAEKRAKRYKEGMTNYSDGYVVEINIEE